MLMLKESEVCTPMENFFSLCTSLHSATLHGLLLCGSGAVVPKCFHFAIMSLKVDYGISRKEGISRTDPVPLSHSITVTTTRDSVNLLECPILSQMFGKA